MGESFVVNSEAKDKGFAVFAHELFVKHKHVTFTWATGEKNSWPMKKTWRMWMSETAKWMADRGATMPLLVNSEGVAYKSRPFDANDAHELFVRQYLGVNENGERYKTATDDKAQMLHMMNLHVQWTAERGLSLTIPKDGEYMKLNGKTHRA